MNIEEEGLLEHMTTIERIVWLTIKHYKGKSEAIKAPTLAHRLGLPVIVVRQTISSLVRNHGKMIGSSTNAPAGFYIITDKNEYDAHVRSLRHRGIMCLVRAAALSKSSIEEIFGQARMEIKKG